MDNPLRNRQTPNALAASKQVIEIAEKIGSFDRLSAAIEADLDALDSAKVPADWRESEVIGQLRFGFAAGTSDLPVLEGELEARVYAVCQRCLQPMQLPLAAELKYLLAEGEFDGFDVWELEHETLEPADVVDEVLVMAMPISALHADAEACVEFDAAPAAQEDTTRPFADLRQQMKQKQ